MKTLLLICFIVCCVDGYGQHITLKETNEPLTKVFRDLEKITGYQFFFADSDIKLAKRISFDVKNDDLTDILNICFKNQPLTYSVSGTTVMVKRNGENLKKNESLNTPDNIVNIHGQVTDSLGNPLVGASVLVKGSQFGITTDAKGRFTLQNIEEPATLKISYTGYAEKDYKIAGNTENNISIALARSNNKLDEIQVIAYGKISKRLNTGDQTTVTAKEIEQQPVANPLLALGGLVPGMTVSQATGLPGTAVTIQIRGQNSLFSGNDPLYIIDGVPYTAQNYLPSATYILGSGNTTTAGTFNGGSPFSYINPDDIESIDILKDADATAIYGTRGANGVILITTKKGKTGQTKVDINIQDGLGKVADKMKLLSTRQYLDMRYEAFKNDGATPGPGGNYDLTLWDTTRQTDWQKELIGGTAQFTDAQATVSGGNANTQFLIGAGYNKQTTVFPGTFSDQKVSVSFNISNTSPNQKFSVQLSGMYLLDNNRLPGYDLTQQALQLAPDAPPMYNPDGSINWAHNATGTSTWPNYNPAAMVLLKYNNNTGNLISNAILAYHIIPGLDIKSSFGYTSTQTNEVQTIPLVFYDPSVRPYVQRKADFVDNNIRSWIIVPQITYNRKISYGTLSALIGTTIQQNTSTSQAVNAAGFNSDLQLQDMQAATTLTSTGSIYAVYKYNALFGRINYNWQDKYLINLTVNRDGSSRFGPENQFHNFGALGAGWIFSKENFIPQQGSFLSFGKLRVSYGTTGSDQVGDYTFMDLYAPITAGVPYQAALGFQPTRIYTPNLAWEETTKAEIGLELGFLEDRIYFSSGFYRNHSSNQLIGYTLPTTTGFTSVEKNLPATVQNQGAEFQLKTVNIKTRDFNWTSSFNISFNRNKFLSGAAGLSDYYQGKVGHSLSSQYVYHYIGVDLLTGLYQFAGAQGITSNPNPATDATVLVNYEIKFYGGFQNSLNYKGFQLDFLLQFTSQPNAYNYQYKTIPGTFTGSFGGNQPVGVMDRWQKPGDVTPFQKFSQNGTVTTPWNNLQQSDGVLMDGSYIRLKNVSLSWQLPATWQKNAHLKNAMLYLHAQNLFTWTHYTGLDPETGSLSVPPLKVLTLGVHLTL